MNLRHLMVAARTLSGHVDRRRLTEEDEVEIGRLIDLLEDETAELVRPEDLIGSKAAAELLDIEKSTLTRWRREGYMPAPFVDLASGPVWLKYVLEAFKAEHEQSADAAGRRPVGSRAAAST